MIIFRVLKIFATSLFRRNMTLKLDFSEKALKWISKKSASSIQTLAEGYDPPKIFTNKDSGEKIQPDFSFESYGGAKSYTEIALKSESPEALVTRWKLLSVMAGMSNGKLYLLAPKGHKMFTEKLVERYRINAKIHSI